MPNIVEYYVPYDDKLASLFNTLLGYVPQTNNYGGVEGWSKDTFNEAHEAAEDAFFGHDWGDDIDYWLGILNGKYTEVRFSREVVSF